MKKMSGHPARELSYSGLPFSPRDPRSSSLLNAPSAPIRIGVQGPTFWADSAASEIPSLLDDRPLALLFPFEDGGVAFPYGETGNEVRIQCC
jgi:hypothetical protein